MTYLKPQSLLLCAVIYTPCLFAAKIQVIGTGGAVSEPDQVSLSLSIQARCYASVADASQAVDTIAQDLFPKLNSLFPKKDDLNQVSTHGGYTQSYYPPIYRDAPSPCQNTFQKITQIKINSTELKDFETVYNEVQKLVYNNYKPENNETPKEANTFVTISQPTPELSFEKAKALEMKALEAALENAREKAQKLVSKTEGANLTLIEIEEGVPQTQPMPMLRAAQAGFASADASAPIAFEHSRLEKQITATFEY